MTRCRGTETCVESRGSSSRWRSRCPAVRTTSSRRRKRRSRRSGRRSRTSCSGATTSSRTSSRPSRATRREERDLHGHRRIARADGGRQDAGRADRGGQRADERPVAAAGDRRELPAAQVGREFPAADGRARGHGEPDRRRSACATTMPRALQHAASQLPVQRHREDVRLQGIPYFEAPPTAQQAPKVDFKR